MCIHKATEGPGPIKSLCEPGYFQLAEQWKNVTCKKCLAYLIGEPDAKDT